MLLNSFAFEKADDITPDKCGKIWQGIVDIENYILWCVKKPNVDETKQLMFFHAISHYDEKEGNLKAYLKRLAQTIYTTTTSKELVVDMSDGNMVYAVGNNEGNKPNESNLITKTPEKVTPDFSTDIIDSLYLKEELEHDIYSLVLDNLTEYVVLCKALIAGDIASGNYSAPFIKQCLALSHQYKDNFNTACLELYNTYKDIFDRFAFETVQVNTVDNIDKLWHETDYNLLTKKKSKRVIFQNVKTHQVVQDADKEKFYVIGLKNLVKTPGQADDKTKEKNKRVLKVDFAKAWHYLCDKVDDSQTNEMKLVLGNDFIIKTLGGSLSIVNPTLYNVYELLKAEFLTNILYETSGRLISVGSKNAYILWDKDLPTLFQQNLSKLEVKKDKKWVNHKNIFGVEFDLIFEDITDKLDSR